MPPSKRRRRPSGSPSSSRSRSGGPSIGSGPSRPPAESEAVDPDKEHYSYEEMIDHLRKVRSTSDTQGLKSKKKRRRRSHQPIKEKRKRQMMMVMIFLFLILPVVAYVGGSYLFSYLSYGSERFRKELSISVGRQLELTGEFEDRCSISGVTIKNRRYSGTGPDDSVVADVRFTNIEAQLRASSLVSNAWKITQLVVDEAALHLRPISNEAASQTPGTANLTEPLRILAAGLGFSGAPNAFDSDRISFRKFSATFGANPDVPHRLDNLHLVMNRTSSGFLMDCDKGTLKYFYWPLFHIKAADLSIDGNGKLSVHRATLVTEDGGTCELAGEIQLTGSEPSIDLTAEITNIKVDNLVNKSTWGDRVLGLMSGELRLEGSLTAESPPVLTGKIAIPGLSIKNLDFLSSMSKYCGIAALSRVEFDQVFEANIRQIGSEVTIHEIYGRNPSLVALTGEFTVKANHDLEGSFMLGLPELVLDKIERGRPQFFESRNDGSQYGWAPFTITGGLENPIDDLRPRFELFLQGDHDPREHRRPTEFRRPPSLAFDREVYYQRLEQLFERFTE